MKRALIILTAGCIILIGIPFIVSAQNLPYNTPCIENADCASLRCELGTCKCIQDGECLTGQYCDSTGLCLTKGLYGNTCTLDIQCASGWCDVFYGECGCTKNSDCPTGRTCNSAGWCVNSTGTLLSYGSSCTADAQCASDFCEPLDGVLTCLCQQNSDCPSTTPNCNVATNQCNSATSGNVNCWIVTSDGTDWSYEFDSEAECRSECQNYDCEYLYGDDCIGWCCNAMDENARNVTCVGSTTSGGSSTIPNPLKCDDVECLVQTIADLIAGLVTVIGTIMIIIGGIQYITSAGSEDKARRAKNTVLYAIIGIAIAVSVDFIVGFLREILSSGN